MIPRHWCVYQFLLFYSQGLQSSKPVLKAHPCRQLLPTPASCASSGMVDVCFTPLQIRHVSSKVQWCSGDINGSIFWLKPTCDTGDLLHNRAAWLCTADWCAAGMFAGWLGCVEGHLWNDKSVYLLQNGDIAIFQQYMMRDTYIKWSFGHSRLHFLYQ